MVRQKSHKFKAGLRYKTRLFPENKGQKAKKEESNEREGGREATKEGRKKIHSRYQCFRRDHKATFLL